MKQEQNSTTHNSIDKTSNEMQSQYLFERLESMAKEIALMRKQIKEYEEKSREEIKILRSLLEQLNSNNT